VPQKKDRTLFLCTGNACRSQMAEGWTRHPKGDVLEPYPASIETHGLDGRAVRVMAEAGVDISGQRLEHRRADPTRHGGGAPSASAVPSSARRRKASRCLSVRM